MSTPECKRFRRQAIAMLYEDILGRQPAEAEIQFWMGAGLGVDGLADSISKSREATSFETRKRVIGKFYREILARPASEEELRSWASSAVPILECKKAIRSSIESRANQVSEIYSGLLARDASTEEALAQARSGKSLGQIREEIRNSAEARQNALHHQQTAVAGSAPPPASAHPANAGTATPSPPNRSSPAPVSSIEQIAELPRLQVTIDGHVPVVVVPFSGIGPVVYHSYDILADPNIVNQHGGIQGPEGNQRIGDRAVEFVPYDYTGPLDYWQFRLPARAVISGGNPSSNPPTPVSPPAATVLDTTFAWADQVSINGQQPRIVTGAGPWLLHEIWVSAAFLQQIGGLSIGSGGRQRIGGQTVQFVRSTYAGPLLPHQFRLGSNAVFI